MELGLLLFLFLVSVCVGNEDNAGKVIFMLNENETGDKKRILQRSQLLRILQKLRNEHERLFH